MSVAPAWFEANTFHHSEYSAERLAAERELSVSICLPARNEEATIGPILERLVPLVERGAVDEVVVIDASDDSTAEIARGLGAVVYEQAALVPALGPVLGKGDAIWRALSVLTGDVVCYLDADTEGFGEHFACGLVGPVACDARILFAKGCYRRPFKLGDERLPAGGGRVTELMARPLLNLFYPELAGFVQPLAGEFAARRTLLERLPFATGYAVEIALLLDAWRAAGLDALAQVDLDVRQNRHQPLAELGPMAYAVLGAVMERVEADGRLNGFEGLPPFLIPAAGELEERLVEIVERPPMASLSGAALS